jgi:hypothetical protein
MILLLTRVAEMLIHLRETGSEDECRNAENFYQIVCCSDVTSLVFSKILPPSSMCRDQVE